MAILNAGKNAAFNVGLESTITQMKLLGTTGQVGATKSITMSHSTTVDGLLETDLAVDFSVPADTTITQIVLLDTSNNAIWTIDLAQSYTFSVSGTFTVEEAFVQFNYVSNAIDVGGLTEWGAAALIKTGWVNEIDIIGTVRSDGVGGVLSTTTAYNDQGTASTIGSATFNVTLGEFSLITNLVSQIYIDAFGVSVPKFFLMQSDVTEDVPYFYFLFATAKQFNYPNNLTINDFSVTIN